MTTASRIDTRRTDARRTDARPHRRAAAGLLAAATVLAPALPSPATAQDCTLEAFDDPISVTKLRDESEANFACVRQRLEALETKRAELERRLEAVERQGAGAPGVYRNEDGRVIRDERHLAPATFVLTGDRQGRPRSLELDRARVLEMCADAEGCLLTLGLEGVVLNGAPLRAMFSTGPCQFHLDAEENAWALSGLCAQADLPAASEGAEPVPGAPVWGRDGDARPLGGTGQSSQVILGFGGACYLAEAQPETRGAESGGAGLARDIRPDLFLVTAGTGWNPAGAFPTALLPLGLGDPDFRCSLTIRD